MNDTNRWAPWGLICSLRDGYPVLTDGAFWQLLGAHPEAIERVSDTELYLHLDQPYRVIALDYDRAFRLLEPAPGRKAPPAPPKPVAA